MLCQCIIACLSGHLSGHHRSPQRTSLRRSDTGQFPWLSRAFTFPDLHCAVSPIIWDSLCRFLREHTCNELLPIKTPLSQSMQIFSSRDLWLVTWITRHYVVTESWIVSDRLLFQPRGPGSNGLYCAAGTLSCSHAFLFLSFLLSWSHRITCSYYCFWNRVMWDALSVVVFDGSFWYGLRRRIWEYLFIVRTSFVQLSCF